MRDREFMKRLLFVCHGNICRSPSAEFIFKDIVKNHGVESDYKIESAATSNDEIWNGVGSPVYPQAAELLKRHGIECEGKRARKMVKSDYDNFDLLLGMDNANISEMKRIAGGDGDHKIHLLLAYTNDPHEISDPWYTRDFEKAYSEINQGCEALFIKLNS